MRISIINDHVLSTRGEREWTLVIRWWFNMRCESSRFFNYQFSLSVCHDVDIKSPVQGGNAECNVTTAVTPEVSARVGASATLHAQKLQFY